ncbi:hypothetical protein D3C75_814080 [compost metagenome]
MSEHPEYNVALKPVDDIAHDIGKAGNVHNVDPAVYEFGFAPRHLAPGLGNINVSDLFQDIRGDRTCFSPIGV